MATLLRALVETTGLSRRKAFAAIRDGRVAVDGNAIIDPSSPYNGGILALDGAPVAAAPSRRAYLLLNKPPGVVSTRSDERGRKTVMDLVPQPMRAPGLHPVGRLDLDTSGLLLLTNDGDLTYHLTHPSLNVEKEYWVGLDSPPTETLLGAIRAGVELDGLVRQPVALHVIKDQAPFDLSIILAEGRKRQVRRMFELAGARVRHLRRVREGPLELGRLREGEVRRLANREVAALRGEAGLDGKA